MHASSPEFSTFCYCHPNRSIHSAVPHFPPYATHVPPVRPDMTHRISALCPMKEQRIHSQHQVENLNNVMPETRKIPFLSGAPKMRFHPAIMIKRTGLIQPSQRCPHTQTHQNCASRPFLTRRRKHCAELRRTAPVGPPSHRRSSGYKRTNVRCFSKTPLQTLSRRGPC